MSTTIELVRVPGHIGEGVDWHGSIIKGSSVAHPPSWRLVVWGKQRACHSCGAFEGKNNHNSLCPYVEFLNEHVGIDDVVESTNYDMLRRMAKNRGHVLPTLARITRAIEMLPGSWRAVDEEREATHTVKVTNDGAILCSRTDREEQRVWDGCSWTEMVAS